MSVIRLSTRYAKALLDLALEQNALDEIMNDVRDLRETIKKSRDFNLFLKSPIIHVGDKLGVVEKLFKGKLNKTTYLFLEIMVKKRRESYLVDVLRSFEDSYNEYNNIVPVHLTTASPVSDEARNIMVKAVKTATGSENVQLKEEVDPSIVGGYILHFDDRQFDASVRRSLNMIKDEFDDNEYIKKF